MPPIAILAGGLATRLHPITQTTPKALIMVGGKPFIHWQLKYLAAQKITDVVFCLGYLAEQISAFVGDGSSYKLNVTYSYDGKQLKGTGGAIKNALPLLGKEFFVIYGDTFLPIEFWKVYDEFMLTEKPGLMTVLRNNNRWDVSNVIFENGRIVEYNKKKQDPRFQYIDYGLGLLKASVFREYDAHSKFDLSEIYHRLSIEGELKGFEVFERFYEIGSSEGIEETSNYLNARLNLGVDR